MSVGLIGVEGQFTEQGPKVTDVQVLAGDIKASVTPDGKVCVSSGEKGKGPSKVANQNYRDNWGSIFQGVSNNKDN